MHNHHSIRPRWVRCSECVRKLCVRLTYARVGKCLLQFAHPGVNMQISIMYCHNAKYKYTISLLLVLNASIQKNEWNIKFDDLCHCILARINEQFFKSNVNLCRFSVDFELYVFGLNFDYSFLRQGSS